MQVTFQNNVCNLKGNEVKVGDNAPVVSVINSNPMLQIESVGQASKEAQLLIVVPSLDTPVCDMEVRKFSKEATSLNNVKTMVISMDLPFAAARFCSTADIANLAVCSDFQNKDFANAYGVLIADGALKGLTCRAIFVIDTFGKIAYKEIVSEITNEPDYKSALEAAKKASGTGCCGHCS